MERARALIYGSSSEHSPSLPRLLQQIYKLVPSSRVYRIEIPCHRGGAPELLLAAYEMMEWASEAPTLFASDRIDIDDDGAFLEWVADNHLHAQIDPDHLGIADDELVFARPRTIIDLFEQRVPRLARLISFALEGGAERGRLLNLAFAGLPDLSVRECILDRPTVSGGLESLHSTPA